MSIIVKGMMMPENCETCEYQTKGACFALGVNKGTITIRRIDKERTDWCPLVEIPSKHGRLIDADELLAESQKDGAYGYVDSKQICDAPTVIEAEGE